MPWQRKLAQHKLLGYNMFARHVCRADGLKETLSPNRREDNP
ncbi:hypothetical protein [Desulfotomaculum nigrificans]|nr:hypothetical protein [Desulfotomaculum nigrificans]